MPRTVRDAFFVLLGWAVAILVLAFVFHRPFAHLVISTILAAAYGVFVVIRAKRAGR